MRDLLILAGKLFLITAVAGLALALANAVTAPRIADQQAARLNASLREVLPAADHFQVQSRLLQKLTTKRVKGKAGEGVALADVRELYQGYRGKEPAGYVVKVGPTGYAGPVVCLVGIAQDGVVAGVQVLEQAETPGLGTRVTEDAFLGQFKGKTPQERLAVTKDGGQIQAITGATISSRAVTRAVATALAVYEEVARP